MTSLRKQLETGDGRKITVEDITKLYRSIVNLPNPKEGRIQRLSEDQFSLMTKFSAIDCDTLKAVNNSKIYSLAMDKKSKCISSVRCVSDPLEVVEIARVTSENGRYMARLKSPSKSTQAPDSSSEKTLLEIWERGRHLKTFDTSELKLHGRIFVEFGSLAWSKSGLQDKLLYVCQPKRPKAVSFLKSEENDDTDSQRGEEFVKREDWGECYEGIEHSIVAVLDVGNDFKITTIDVDGHSLSTPQWLDNSSKIVSVAYAESTRRLGLIYCNNRPSKLMVHDWQSQKLLFEFSSDKECFHSPRASNSGNKFIYLSNPIHGVHIHSVTLSICDIGTGTNARLINEQFIRCLPKSPFSSDDSHVLFVKTDHLYSHMCLCNVNDSKVTTIKFPTTDVEVLDFKYDIILASGSEVNATPTIFVAVINSNNTDDVVAWHQIEDCIHLSEVEYDAYKIPIDDQSSFISSLFVKPVLTALREDFPGREGPAKVNLVSESQLPTVVFVHGGPHSAFSLYYSQVMVFLARLGLKSILINYRGSTGVSEEYLQCLSGKAGEQDVEDCLTAIRYFIKNKLIEPTKLIIQGGSHGGFLACHLSCQDEFKFTSAIIRNPVVDLTTMHTTTDIPDWVSNVGLGYKRFDASWMPSNQELITLYEHSPMSRFEKAYVPTLMLLGSKDKRVKMFQGERWIDLLKAKGVETLCKIYPDKHGLVEPEYKADCEITAAIWILDHLVTKIS